MSPLSIAPLAPFGVEIDHDLSAPLDAEEASQLRALFREHGLLVARGQSLSMARQEALCAHLGPILEREGETGVLSNELGGPSASAYAWHSDAAYTEHPFDALCLHALDVVDDASSTRFASAERAFEALPPELLARVEGLEQTMISPDYRKLDRRSCDERDPDWMKRGIRPLVLSNPHNGRRCLWASEMQTARVESMEWEAGRDLLYALFDHLYAPGNVVEHRWRTGDLVLWDNIALQHARDPLDTVGRRRLQRVIVGVEGAAPHVGAGASA